MSEKMTERSYETIYIIRADLADEAEKKVQDKVLETISRFGGKLESAKDLMKRPLAYPIAKHTKGHYIQLNYLGTGQVVEELERHLRLDEDIIRFLTVRPALPNTPRPARVKTEKAQKVQVQVASRDTSLADARPVPSVFDGRDCPSPLISKGEGREGRQEVSV